MARISLDAFLAAGLFAALSPSLRAEPLSIDLTVQIAGEPASKKSAGLDATPPSGGVNPRPVLKLQADQELQVVWSLTNASPHGTLKDVVVHFYIAREDALGQKAPPSPANIEKNHVIETAFEMAFEPKAKAGGRFKIKVPEPGAYLLRVESLGTKDVSSNHEDFAAIDLDVR